MLAQGSANAAGAIAIFWRGFFSRSLVQRPEVELAPGGWSRDGRGHDLENSSTSSRSTWTSITRAPYECPPPPPAVPEALKVVGEGSSATVEVPVLAGGAALAGVQARPLPARWRRRRGQIAARRVLEPLGEARIHVS